MTGLSEHASRQGYEKVLHPIVSSSIVSYAFLGVLLIVVGLGVYAYLIQLSEGLVVTGLRSRVVWGPYIVNVIFFLAIGMAGTVISAILRLTGADWRRPITRMAEATTVFAVAIGMLNVVFDMGRPDRIANLFLHGRIDSPLIWDLTSITSYLVGSSIFLYLTLIPDTAELSRRVPASSRFKGWLYRTLSLGWIGSEDQNRRLGRAIAVMAVVIVPVAVSVHSVLSWLFAVTLRPGYHSTIFGPYFVVAALFSGTATIILVMATFRKYYHLHDYITAQHFDKLAKLLLGLGLAYLYFMVSEYLVEFYAGKTETIALLANLFWGDFAQVFWTFTIACLLFPVALLAIPKTRTVRGIVLAAFLINVGMWLKRFVMVVAPLANPLMPWDWARYQPTWVELSITAGSVAAFALLLTVFSKTFPIISLWEMREEHERPEAENCAKSTVFAGNKERTIG